MLDRNLNALLPGTVLDGYRIERELGSGGFGITYLAVEVESGRKVAIKEYMPKAFAQRGPGDFSIRPVNSEAKQHFEWGLERFRDEARALIRLHHPNIVLTLRLFSAHGTAYIVMHYVEGESLRALLEGRRTLDEAEVRSLLDPLLDGLGAVHEAGYLHRDLKPANIFIRGADRRPVILDFGAAREALGRETQTLSAIVTPGYSPPEQYGRGVKQKESADIYALAATLYRCVTGETPPEAPDRVSAMVMNQPDPLLPAAQAGRGKYSLDLLAAIDHALNIRENERPQSTAAFRALLRGATTAPRRQPARRVVPPMARGDETLVAGPSDRFEQPPPPTPLPRGSAASPRPSRWALAALAATFTIAGAAGAYLALRWERQPTVDAKDFARAVEEARRKAEEDAARKRREEAERAEAEEKRRQEEAARRMRQPGAVFRDCDGCPEMVTIPAGTFTMGTAKRDSESHNDERPEHDVTIPKMIAIGKYEITFEEFDVCTREGGCAHKPDEHGWGRGSQPVIDVSWHDAKDYVAWLSRKTGKAYRLPSEAEWEYSARAGSTTRYAWGDEIVAGRAHCDGCQSGASSSQALPVGRFAANAFGLHDLHGNVSEWTEDCAHSDYSGAPRDGSAWVEGGDCTRRITRGGAWNGGPRNIRAADRGRAAIAFRGPATGFRVVREF